MPCTAAILFDESDAGRWGVAFFVLVYNGVLENPCHCIFLEVFRDEIRQLANLEVVDFIL